ncbi:MAG: fluoride efflux transporter CrcB [Acidimicrobiales bacterium]
MSALVWLGFLAAGALGAVLRYLADQGISRRVQRRLPWGTFAVNASGSLLLGVLTGLVLYHAFPKAPMAILGTGFCGAYTTFSTFSFETVRLLEDGAVSVALRNAVGTLVTCAGAAALGLLMATL